MNKEEFTLVVAIGVLLIGIAILNTIPLPQPAEIPQMQPTHVAAKPVLPKTAVTGMVYVYNPTATVEGKVEVIGG